MASWNQLSLSNRWLLQVDLAGHSEWLRNAPAKLNAARDRAEFAERLSSSLQLHAFETAFWAGDGGLFTCPKENALADDLVDPINEVFEEFSRWQNHETGKRRGRDRLGIRVSLHEDEILHHKKAGYWYSDELNLFLKYEREIAINGTAVITGKVHGHLSEESQKLWTYVRDVTLYKDVAWPIYRYTKFLPTPCGTSAKRTPVDSSHPEEGDGDEGARGIVPYQIFAASENRLAGEEFSSELLTQPLFLSRVDGRLRVQVNRSDVTSVVISNPGKKRLCQQYVKPRRSELVSLDRRILEFMRRSDDGESIEVPTVDLPLRWASGGVLSLVEWKGRKWAPLFFRDIPPYGWNLALGSTERNFDNRGRQLDDGAHEAELRKPWKYVVREFLEETLVLEDYPQFGQECRWRRFEFSEEIEVELSQDLASAFAKKHKDVRNKQDGLRFLQGQDLPVTVMNDTDIDLRIERPMSQEDGMISSNSRNVLVAINLLELGIEVVKVVEYELGDKNCILDGEYYLMGRDPQMIRMPMGLISLDYLFKNFGTADLRIEYSDDEVQPSVEGSLFEAEDVHVWGWDAKRRKEIWGAGGASDWEKTRYKLWQALFEDDFRSGLSGKASAFPHTFTPTTVKIVNLFFNCCKAGRALALERQYR